MNLSTLRFALALCGIGACVAPLGACGGRPSFWNDSVNTTGTSYGLINGVALVDDTAHRVVMLTVPGADLQLNEQSLPSIGHQVVSVSVSPDKTRLFVLSAGDWPRRTVNDEFPSLTMIDFPNGFVAQAHRYEMTEPLANLALDPVPGPDNQEQYAVAYAGSATGPASTSTSSFVQNPNEIVLFDLKNQKTVTRTIQSFGGTPRRIVFTPELELPAGKGQRRLLLIETDIDLTMLDLDHAFDLPSPPPEITVPLTSGTTTEPITTAGIAIDGRSMTDPNDARFAVWASNNTNVFTLQLVAPTTNVGNDFFPTLKLTDVGGIPSDVAFVQTEDPTSATGVALQVAALVPSTSSAVLVDPDTSLTTTVTLPAAYASFSLVTDLVAGTSATNGTDVALLWNGNAGAQSGVALWTLTHSVMQPYASIQTLGATQPITQAYDVPPPNERLKVLQMASGNGFYVLDLAAHTAPPLDTTQTATLSIAPHGKRVWAFDRGGTDLASIDLNSLNPVPLTTDLPIDGVYEVVRPDGGGALIAIHNEGAIGATVFDAVDPVTATSRRVAPLVLEGP